MHGRPMAILSKMYFNAVFGALGGLLGWMLFGVLGDRNPSTDREHPAFLLFTHLHLHLLLGGAIIGALIGFFVGSVEAFRDQSLVRFVRLSTYGFVLALLGGLIGMYA